MTDRDSAEVLDRAEFERLNGRLLGVAYRLLGSWADAEEVVAETWLRWHDRRPATVNEPIAWLTTVTTRLSLDRWRTLSRRKEDYIGPWLPEPIDPARLPHETAEQRQSLAFGLLHLMDRLTPDERAVYVLRNAFDHPYAEIATMLGRTAASCRQLEGRARAKIDLNPENIGVARERPLIEALLSAVVEGRAADAIALITEDAVLISDSDGRVKAARRPIVGPQRIVRFLLFITGSSSDATVDLVEVNAGIGVRFVTDVTVRLAIIEAAGDRVGRLHLVGNPDKLGQLPAHGLSGG